MLLFPHKERDILTKPIVSRKQQPECSRTVLSIQTHTHLCVLVLGLLLRNLCVPEANRQSYTTQWCTVSRNQCSSCVINFCTTIDKMYTVQQWLTMFLFLSRSLSAIGIYTYNNCHPLAWPEIDQNFPSLLLVPNHSTIVQWVSHDWRSRNSSV